MPIRHPPSLPTLEQVLVMQARMLQTMQQTMVKRRHHRQGIGWEIFSTLSHLPFLMLWSRWMLMIG
jgi:hypothetical protein